MNCKKLLSAIALLTTLWMVVGCSSTIPQSITDQPAPLRYDIQYSDGTAVGIELLILSRETSSIQETIDAAVLSVVSEIPKTELLEQQDRFRTELSMALSTGEAGQSTPAVIVLDISPTEVLPAGRSDLSLR